MNRAHLRWYSHRLRREMELLVFGHAGAKVPPQLSNGWRLRRLRQTENGVRHQLHFWDGRAHRAGTCRKIAPLCIFERIVLRQTRAH